MSAPWSRRRSSLGWLSLALLAATAIPLALAGPGLVPATVGGEPGWLVGPYGAGAGLSGTAFFAFLVAAFAAYLGVVVTAGALPRRALWSTIAAAVLFFALAPPLLSQDVFSYVSYARLGAEHGLNPYDSVPADVPGDPALRFVGWRDTTSAYGPLFTLGSYPAGVVGVPLALWMLKVAAAASVLGLAALVARIACARGVVPAAAAAFVALNPLVLVHVVGGAHNDGLMMLLVMGGVALMLARAEAAAGGVFVAAAAIKAAAVFAAPFALLGARHRLSFVAGAAVAGTALATVTLAAFGPAAFGSLGLVGQNQGAMSRYSVPATAARALDVGVEPLRYGALALYAVALVWLLLRTARGDDWVRAAGWAGLGLLLATGWLMPWYVIWVLPFAAVTPDRSLRVAVLALCAFQLVNRIPF